MFEILKYDNENYNQYVFLTDCEDLDDEVYDIYDVLEPELGNSFRIIVDCLLRTGNAYNRFIQLVFSEGKLKESIIINPRNVDDYLKCNTLKQLSLNIDLLNCSALSIREKTIILNSIN